MMEYGAARRRKKPKWTEKGIDQERAQMKKLADRFAQRAAAAKKKGHPVHARAMMLLSKNAQAEYKRLTRVDKLSGPDMDAPRRYGMKALAAAVLLGFLAGRA